MNKTNATTMGQILTSEQLLKHWQGHRGLTRKVIEAFPEKEFFTHHIGGMRTFAEMTMELLGIAGPGLMEIVTGEQAKFDVHFDHKNQKANILAKWDETTEVINTHWGKISEDRFADHFESFGQYEGTVLSTLLYFIDNEIHHRGQGYVYLRDLGVEPPFFWDRISVDS